MKKLRVEIPEQREPWLIPLKERIDECFMAIKQGKKINLMLYDHAETSTFRYRCYNLMQWSKESDQWLCMYFFRSEMDTVFELLKHASILSLVRLQWFHAVDRLVYEARKLHIPIVYDVDDRVFDLDALPMMTNSIAVDLSLDRHYEFWFAYFARNGFTASRADCFTTTNDYLGGYLQEKFGKPYRVIRNSLNHEQLSISEKARHKKRLVQRDISDEFIIGYFSGSPSHNNDLAIIAPELAMFLNEHRNAKLYVVGFMQFPEILQPAIAREQIVFEPLTDFLNLQVLTAGVDVNIVPLLDNSFTNCKSELKFFEAGVVDTLTIASPIYTYRHCIRDGENGYLCMPGQWYSRLNDVYEHWADQRPLIEKAREDSEKHYSGAEVIAEMESAFDAFVSL